MNLLIVTQKMDVNDPILGFFHRWVEEFALYFPKITVVCLYEGTHNLPRNVSVRSLGKEKGVNKITFVINFYREIFSSWSEYKYVFVHMNPIYVALAGPVWRLGGKKVSLWYTHRSVDLKLRLAVLWSHKVFTASPESFQLNTNKKIVTGHGIDIDKFERSVRLIPLDAEPIRIIHVGRITKIKNCLTLVESAKILRDKCNRKFEISFIGDAVNEDDKKYFDKIRQYIAENNLSSIIHFQGNLVQHKVIAEYGRSSLSVNLTPTGGVDKSVLESMATGLPVMSSNRAFRAYFGRYSDDLMFELENHEDLAHKIMSLYERVNLTQLSEYLKQTAREKSSLSTLIKVLDREITSI